MGGLTVGDEIPLLSWSLHLLGEAEWAGRRGRPFAVLPPRAAVLDSCVEARAVSVAGRRSGSGFGPRLFRGMEAGPGLAPVARLQPGIYPVARSGLRTLPDGEFDWGGTSVKR